jgi:uncharacterized HhH-GPD family protein
MADWSRLTRFLQDSDAARVELSFARIESILGSELPASSRYPAFWSNSSFYAAAWKGAGYETTRRGVLSARMAFVRVRSTPATTPSAAPTEGVAPGRGRSVGDVILIGCVKTKAEHPALARDLYRSALFDRRRCYAEAAGQPWFILSAEHGLLEPTVVIEPYDVYLAHEASEYRTAWGEWVAAKLQRRLGDLHGRRVEVHAGAAYVEAIQEPLRRRGAQVLNPLAGLRQGEQLAWYTHEPGDPPAAPADLMADIGELLLADLVILDGPHPTGSFRIRWPETTEEFDRGWDVTVETGGKRYRVRHGLGTRQVYGASRRHSVTFIDGWAAAEAAGEDDFEDSRHLISALKAPDGTLVRPGDPIPPPYRTFPLTSQTDHITGPYSRTAVAVRLHEDDLTSWVGYGLARLTVKRATEPAAADATSRVPAEQPVQAPTSTTREAVVQALLAYGDRQATAKPGKPTFTPHPAANELVLTDPFAFLLAVIFDQGIPAERAWRAPYDLSQRLGHLDPHRMTTDPDAVRDAVGQPPVLHRYREKMPSWLLAAAGIVTDHYDGHAERIWNDEPSARELQQRLDRLPGIGQKKAAMAVEILERDLDVPIRDLHGSDIAYDVHVRRVFLRTRLADYDDLDHMVQVARQANPDRPGAIDFPAWLVGRQWCHAGLPDCPSCVLRDACPQDVSRANTVRGA